MDLKKTTKRKQKRNNKRIVYVALVGFTLLTLLASPVFAEIEIGKGGFLEKAEPVFEVVNLVLALVTLMLALLILPNVSGIIKENWIYVIIAVSTFAMVELLGVLKGFNIFRWYGLGDVFEFVFVTALLLSVYKQHKLFMQLLGKAEEPK